jgi:hypothetical protein
LSEEFIRKNAFDMGREVVRANQLIAEYHQTELDDDYYPGVIFHPGAGYQAALSTGANVTFGVGTDRYGASYMDTPLLDSLDNVERVFNHDNRWIEYALEFWRGVSSCDLHGLAVTPRYNRSPLDLAWDLRGQDIFTDMHEEPEALEYLLRKCAESIIEIDRIFRREIPLLREALGGAQGVAPGAPTMILNGDPLDLISEEFVLRFNNPPLQKVVDYSPALVLHHHSIGIRNAQAVSRIKGLDVQEIYQDAGEPRTGRSITPELVEASLRTPLFLEFPLADIEEPLEQWAEQLAGGRFIIHFWCDSAEEARHCVEVMRQAGQS